MLGGFDRAITFAARMVDGLIEYFRAMAGAKLDWGCDATGFSLLTPYVSDSRSRGVKKMSIGTFRRQSRALRAPEGFELRLRTVHDGSIDFSQTADLKLVIDFALTFPQCTLAMTGL
jgi:hypothetical protein